MTYGWATRGTVKTRDGQRRSVRDDDTKVRALEGHKNSAHGGEFVRACAACRELERAANASLR